MQKGEGALAVLLVTLISSATPLLVRDNSWFGPLAQRRAVGFPTISRRLCSSRDLLRRALLLVISEAKWSQRCWSSSHLGWMESTA